MSEPPGKEGSYHSTRLSSKRGLAYNDAAMANAFSDAFLQNVIPKLESLEYLAGYAYFMVSEGSLMSGSNTLSDAGRVYAA
ncbi:hypothetical protein O9K51_10713 [Purpureocillium lavendulum]|uniref:Asl1-like glycosyl hydrolase catalytic domain-containing protein n=1 Tax=Purpureocillium lavendulum TaxID=1247861 RepID=A0AB34FBK0_9HYPO|nr:hypothetical protein O9K51_10713 [Purpureocillium lavendulum]